MFGKTGNLNSEYLYFGTVLQCRLGVSEVCHRYHFLSILFDLELHFLMVNSSEAILTEDVASLESLKFCCA